MSRDTISDFLTVIRNGVMVSKLNVTFPYSKICFKIAEILQQEGFIRDVSLEAAGAFKLIKIGLKYVSRESVIHNIKRLSTPGRRIYAKSGDLTPVIGGLGIAILTTNAGLITDKTAKNQKLGGEVICTVW